MREVCESMGLDPDHMPVDSFMALPPSYGLTAAHEMEHGEDDLDCDD